VVIDNILKPKDTLLTNKTRAEDVHGQSISVNSGQEYLKYNMGTISNSLSYRVYFPSVSRQTDSYTGSTFDSKKIIRCAISCQNKIYSLSVSTINTK